MSARCQTLALCVGLAVAQIPASAVADDNDLVLSRLAEVTDVNGNPDAVGLGGDFRSLVSELGVVLAPRLSEPADSLGFGGFNFTADIGITEVHTDRPYWRALESSRDPSGSDHGDGYMTTIGVFARKGIWLPVPSFEVGFGAVHLAQSRIWAGQMYAKLALVEGYHDLPLPSLAIRGAASRMMGSDQLNLTVASIDATISKEVGVASTFNAAPYLGGNWLIIIPRSEVIDKTPHIDSRLDPVDTSMYFVFPDQDNIVRHRLFAGLKLTYHVFSMTLEGAFAFAGSSTDDRPGTSQACGAMPTTDCDATDQSGRQLSFTANAGFDF